MSPWDKVAELVVKLPPRGRYILFASVSITAAAAIGYVAMTPACASRSIIILENNRSSECSANPEEQKPTLTLPKGAKARQPGNSFAPVPIGSHSAPTEDKAPRPAEHAQIIRSVDGQRELREKLGLTLIEAEDFLVPAPDGIYGFVYAGTFASYWKDQNGPQIRNVQNPIYFELQKRSTGVSYIVGYMRADTAKNITEGNSGPVDIKIYSKRYRPTDVVVAVPVANIIKVAQSEITFRDAGIIPVLELSLEFF
jgi:hypothetical protein